MSIYDDTDGAVHSDVQLLRARVAELEARLAAYPALETALRESELRYSSVVMALDTGVVLQDADGSIQSWNASAERILGLNADQLQGRTSMDPRWWAIHEDGSPFPGETHPAMVTLRTGQPCDNVIMGVHKPDGTLTWIKVGSRPLFHPDAAKPYAVVASFTDITDRKQLEEKLREREAQFRLLMTSSLDAVLLTAPDGQIFMANPAAIEMFGYTEEELYAGGRDLIIDSADLRLEPMLTERTRTGMFRGELNHRRRDGTILPAEISSAVFQDRHGNKRTSLIIRDISERKRAEQALRESEERFARVFRSSPVGISITTLADGRLIDINESCERILGYTRAEIAGRTTTELGIWQHSDDRSRVVQVLREQGSYRNWGTQFVNKSGQMRDALVSMERIEIRGEPSLLTMVYDITEWRQLERERDWLITRLNQSLERTDVLYHIASLLNRSYETQEVLQTVVDSAATILPANRTILITVDIAAQQVRQRLEGGPGAVRDSTISFTELWNGLSGVALREHRPVLSPKGIVDDRESEAVRHRRAQEQAGSIVVVPLLTQTTLSGTLTAINQLDELDFSKQDIALLTAVAQQAASVIERAQLLSELRYQATTDGLTQLLNRRAWLGHAERAVAAAQRSLRPLAIILLDADHFKQVNDTYGHDIGDVVLQMIAECCRRTVRKSDIVGRYGGEEFVILLPETDGTAAWEIAERVRNVVANEHISIPHQSLTVTISLGVAIAQGETIELSTTLSQADQALYRAKQAGRNCAQMTS
jgi:diguanylate cyclase (GGDEF)-like protein/PAS domain S-box-containing protein